MKAGQRAAQAGTSSVKGLPDHHIDLTAFKRSRLPRARSSVATACGTVLARDEDAALGL
jgi:hypothetical protein